MKFIKRAIVYINWNRFWGSLLSFLFVAKWCKDTDGSADC